MSDEATLPGESSALRRERLMPLLLAALATVAVMVSIAPFPVGVYQDDGIYTVQASNPLGSGTSAGARLTTFVRPPEITAQQGAVGLPLAANLLAWPALKRKAYRLDPKFAT